MGGSCYSECYYRVVWEPGLALLLVVGLGMVLLGFFVGAWVERVRKE